MVSDAPYDQLLRSTIGAMCYADELGYDLPESDLDLPDLELDVLDDEHLEDRMVNYIDAAKESYGEVTCDDPTDLEGTFERHALELSDIVKKLEKQHDKRRERASSSGLRDWLPELPEALYTRSGG